MALSPMMQQYMKTKEQYNDCILMYRLGDFYEMFFEDAIEAGRILDLVLTGRDCGLDKRAPMCGIPYHAVDNYVAKLVKAGRKVAICEQLTQPGKVLVERDVVRVITAGTVMEDSILDEKSNNYLGCLYATADGCAFSWCDITTGEINVARYVGEKFVKRLQECLVAVNPSEIICNAKGIELEAEIPFVKTGGIVKFSQFYEKFFALSQAESQIKEQYKVHSVSVYEFAAFPECVCGVGALLSFVAQTQKRFLAHIETVKFICDDSYMSLDYNTRRNLELTENSRDRKRRGSLLWLLDKTATGSGGRMLRNWISHPLRDIGEINRRLDAVENLVDDFLLREGLFEAVSREKDVERLTGKLSYNMFTPYDCNLLRVSVGAIPKIKEALGFAKSAYLKDLNINIEEMSELLELISASIKFDAKKQVNENDFIKEGFNAELDKLRDLAFNGKKLLRELEIRERESTGIKTLKVGFNKVFGYFIEVTNSFRDKVPESYIRKQTLVNCERYVTEELKKLEEDILTAEEKFNALEKSLFEELKKRLLVYISPLQKTANAIAQVDALASLAKVAVDNGYCKPVMTEDAALRIKNGRHPVVEEFIRNENYISNDTIMDCGDNRTCILTGPNMAGKSTYMRQVALIVLMAHLGSFVPASAAFVPLTDKIFTRVGASDDLTFNQSTFMVEMLEAAYILNNATKSSLIILDELGRGTSTSDGLSIAQAVIEYINSTIGAKVIFATHFHELNALESRVEGIKNYRIAVKEIGDQIVFLRKIERGAANKSFGIEVAELAGVNKAVIIRAKELAKSIK
ncbi:MAG: DNA mismatch repair protein MutS [Clostridia bacterium]|nr:DNA mismatch repair protein MutS [Clostridia bacterium]